MYVGDTGNDGILLEAADGKVPPGIRHGLGTKITNDVSKPFILCEIR